MVMHFLAALNILALLFLARIDVHAQTPPVKQPKVESNALSHCGNDNSLARVKSTVWGLSSKAYVRGLGPESFLVTSDKQSYPLLCFSAADRPLTVGFLVDFSSSVSKSVIAEAIGGITNFIDKSNPENIYFAVGFSSEPFLLMDRTKDRKEIDLSLTNALTLKPEGRTSFNDAISLALDKMSGDDGNDKVLIVVSDAEDNHSAKGDLGSIRKRLRIDRIRTFIITNVDRRESVSQYTTFLRIDLSNLVAENGGGIVFPKEKKRMTTLFEGLAKRMRNEYTIGIGPPKAEKKWHPITLAVKLPKSFELVSISGPKQFFY